MRFTATFIALTGLLTSFVSSAPLFKRAPANVIETCSVPGTFALTYDDGPNQYTWELIKYLNQQNITATFFINGNNGIDVATGSTNTSDGIKTYMDHIRFMHQSGHQVASHTYSHAHLDSSSPQQIQNEMNQLNDIIFRAINLRPRYMRPPYGENNNATRNELGNLNYQVIIWDIDPKDFEAISYQDKQATVTGVLAKEHSAPPTSSHIILMHDTHQQTVRELTPFVVREARAKGYRFTTVAGCLNDPNPYTN
ncbi:hypothetical protein BJ944DRAFT_170602 [Cunninghamella echinulata]|nr:hypothetical protein BJ944DRAFT_170602 [Cunninghamella echinulata]